MRKLNDAEHGDAGSLKEASKNGCTPRFSLRLPCFGSLGRPGSGSTGTLRLVGASRNKIHCQAGPCLCLDWIHHTGMHARTALVFEYAERDIALSMASHGLAVHDHHIATDLRFNNVNSSMTLTQHKQTISTSRSRLVPQLPRYTNVLYEPGNNALSEE